MNLYYVDLETEEFIEYTSDASRENLSVERRGTDFFSASAKDAQMFIYKEDREYFLESFTKENILRTLDEQGTFTLSYRLQTGENPIYVSMKAVRMPTDRGHIIIGVSNVDAQMRQKEEMARLQAEQITYARINALSRDYICIYTVNPDTDRYVEYGATADYSGLNVPKEGDDFYATSRVQSERVLWPEDVARFQELITKERIMEEIRKNGIFTMRYRMNIDGEPRYTGLKATLIEEQDGPQLIIGVTDIDAQVRREQEYERRLAAARSRAHLDILTGVKNKNAYENMSHNLDRQVEGGQDVHYAIALCRVDGLAEVNEEHGREAGDQLIRDACVIVCNVFKHSPVFRVAGDQFAAVAQGHDYQHADELADELKEISRRNRESGGVVISCGLAKYDGTASVASVFERADRLCREEKEAFSAETEQCRYRAAAAKQ
jgi:diguanylate cyclase (GGDEF)-like protein